MAPAENPIKKQLDALPGANTLRAATTQALRQLRADLGKLDEAVVRVAELDTAGSGEAGRIDGRLGVYAREIARAREDGTGDEERLELLTELERTVADLRGDVTAYRAGDRTREFASEYARIRRIIFSSSGWQHGWANRGRYQDGERDDLEKAIGIISEAKAETAFREIMEAGVWQPYPGGVETGARLAALVARKDLMPTVKKLKEHGVFEG